MGMPNMESSDSESEDFFSIFCFSSGLLNLRIENHADLPVLVSVGPYFKGAYVVREWEKLKLYFVNKYKSRSEKANLLDNLVHTLLPLEQRVRNCYRKGYMSSKDLIETMLIDGCFVVELLYHLNYHEGEIDDADPILTRPWLIPILLSDLLQLANQIPYFVLQLLFDPDLYPKEQTRNPFRLLALQLFKQVYQKNPDIHEKFDDRGGKHLLDLFHSCLNPLRNPKETGALIKAVAATFSDKVTSPNDKQSDQITAYILSKCRYLNITALLHFLNSLIGMRLSTGKGSNRATQSVSCLRSLGIKFKSREAISFLDIKFENNVLEIPSFEINEFTTSVLINCVGYEQGLRNDFRSKYVMDYVYFMGCLLKEPSDVAFLRSEGIISEASRSDEYLSDLFKLLGKEIQSKVVEKQVGSIRKGSYLYQQLTKLQWYCNSPMAKFYLKLTNPKSTLPIYSILLILILTLVQTIMAILINSH